MEDLRCDNNSLTGLNLKNGNNLEMSLNTTNNPNLFCINIDNAVWSTDNRTTIDPQLKIQ